jgi:hypothetical protein
LLFVGGKFRQRYRRTDRRNRIEGREQVAETKRFEDAMRDNRDFALWRTLNVENIARFDRHGEHIFVREKELSLLARRERKDEEASWTAYMEAQGNIPPSQQPSAKSWRLSEDNEDNDDTPSAYAAGRIMEGCCAEEENQRMIRIEVSQRRKYLAQLR